MMHAHLQLIKKLHKKVSHIWNIHTSPSPGSSLFFMGVGSPFCPTGSFFFFGKRPLFSPESVEEFHLIGSSRPVVVNLRNGERDKRRSVSIGDSNIFGCFSGYSHGLCVLSSGEVNLQTWKGKQERDS